jgi:hypothetical protein
MSEITDLGSPDRELSAGDINRKTNKLRRINTRLKNAPIGSRRRHNLEFKKLKTEDQINTGLSGIRPTKTRFRGPSRNSALNMLGVKPKSPLNDNGGIQPPSIVEENPGENPTFTPGTPWSQYSDAEVKANAGSGKPLPKQFYQGKQVHTNINDAWQTAEQAQATEDLENSNN